MKVEVHLLGGLRKIIDIDPYATRGAVVGKNLFFDDGTIVTRADFGGGSAPDDGTAITSWELILNIPPNVVALAEATGTGLFAVTGASTGAMRTLADSATIEWANGDGVAGNPVASLKELPDTGIGALLGITRDAYGRVSGTTDATITGTAGEIEVANGDAAAGPPTISLADVADAGGGTLQKTDFDAKGRKTGTSEATTDDLPEGAANLYFTAARVRATVLTGLSLASSAVIAATDTILSALGKLQAQITALASSLSGYVPTSRTISTAAPLTGGGDLTADRALAISAASGSTAGSMSSADFTKLAGIAAGAQVNAPTNLAQGTRTATTVPVTSSTGTTATLAAATASLAGVMASSDKDKLDGIASGATAYTDADARAAVIASTITNGDTTHAPSGDAVADALAGKLSADGSVIATGDFRYTSASTWRMVSDSAPGSDTTLLRIAASNSPGFSRGAYIALDGVNTASGGQAVIVAGGTADMILTSNSAVRPNNDGVCSSGAATNRWSVVYAATGSINTSDAREKEVRGSLNAQEIAAAQELASAAVIYQWKAALAEKGEAARLHCSPTVQSVIAIMESHGLDPFLYGFVCYDEWDETPEVRDEETGEVTQEYRPAGDRYSLRPSELEAFCRRGMMQKIDSMDARLKALEGFADPKHRLKSTASE